MRKCAQLGLAESMARELHPKGIYVCWINIDGGILNPGRSEAADNPGSMLNPDAIAQSYRHIIDQDRSAWTNEVAVRLLVGRFWRPKDNPCNRFSQLRIMRDTAMHGTSGRARPFAAVATSKCAGLSKQSSDQASTGCSWSLHVNYSSQEIAKHSSDRAMRAASSKTTKFSRNYSKQRRKFYSLCLETSVPSQHASSG